jgi:hypothetical protein
MIQVIEKQCAMCKQVQKIEVCANDYDAWRQGALIQNVFDYLSEDERELLMSGICGKCYDKYFGGEE